MLRRIGVVISVGLADSLNPSTVGPALYLATVQKRVVRVTQFTIGVFGVDLVVGLVLTIGPGRLLLGLVPHPQRTVRHVIELVAGLVLLIVAVALWRGRRSLARRELPMRSGGGRLRVDRGSVDRGGRAADRRPLFRGDRGDRRLEHKHCLGRSGWSTLYNVAFVAATVGDHRDPPRRRRAALTHGSRRAGAWLQRRWPVVLATLLLVVGSGLTVLGGTGLVKQ